MTRYLPIIPPDLDPRNEFQLAEAAKQRVVDASNGQLNDISAGSPVSALMEGHAFAQAELLYYLNAAPEAWTATFLSQVLGIQIIASRRSSVVLEFIRDAAVANTSFVLSSGFRVQSSSGIVFETQNTVEFLPNETIKYVLAESVTEGSDTNVAANTITTPLQNNAGFTSITNPAPAYGGIDGETYAEAKSRAFNQIRRRNPVSSLDYEDLTEDILGIGTRVKVSSSSTAPQVLVNDNLYVDGESNANQVFNAIKEYKSLIGEDPSLTASDISAVTRVLETKSQNTEHLFVSVRGANDTSIDPLLLDRTRQLLQNRSPSGLVIHVENALVQNVDVLVVLQEESLSEVNLIEQSLQEYFRSLNFGEAIDYSSVSALISINANVQDIFITSGLIVTNQGLNIESVVDNFELTLSKSGTTIYTRRAGEDSDVYFQNSDIIPAYGPGSLWFLDEVTVLPASEYLNTVKFGTLLECRSGGVSVRADGSGGTYTTANDRACDVLPDFT